MGTKKESNVTALGYLLAAIFGVFAGVLVLMLTAYVVVDMWSWWMVPAGLPAMPFWVAVGADFIFALLRGPTQDLAGKAHVDVIDEVCSGDFEYVLGVGMYAAKRCIGEVVWILAIWGVAAALHQWVE